MAIVIKKFLPLNWHFLEKCEPINLGKTTFIAGRNMSGKSTLIDALQLLFFVSTDHFNIGNAAGGRREDKRDLTSYVRAKRRLNEDIEGDEETNYSKIYRRINPTNTHVVAECENTETGTTFVIGVTAEAKHVSEGLKPTVTWWSALNCRLEDLEFTKPNPDGKGKRYRTLSEVMEATPAGKTIFPYPTQEKAKIAFSTKQFFYLTSDNKGDKYAFDAWVKTQRNAIAYNPKAASNINKFIASCVVPDKKVDITAFAELINEQSDLRRNLQEMTDKTEKLASLISKAEDYQTKSTHKETLYAAKLLLETEAIVGRLNVEEKKQEKEEETLNTLKQRADKVRSEKAETERLLFTLETKNQDEASKELKNVVDNDAIELKALQEKKASFDKTVSEVALFSEGVNNFFGKVVVPRDFLDLYQSNNGEAFDNQEYFCRQLVDCLNNLDGKISSKISRLEIEEESVSKELNNTKNTLLKLNQSMGTGSPQSERVKEEIAKVFREEGIKDVPYYFSELLEITDDSWADAIESYMNNDRFAIFVLPKNYHTAALVVKKMRDEQGIYGVALVDTPSFEGVSTQTSDNTIASLLKTENTLAREYANYCYGRVFLVENAESPADKNATCIDKDCNRYSRRAFSSMKKQLPVIGKAARLKLIEHFETKKKSLSDDLNDVQRAIRECKQLRIAHNGLRRFMFEGQNTLSDIQRIPAAKERLAYNQKQYEAYLNRPEHTETKKLHEKLAKLSNDLETLNSEIAICTSAEEKYRESIERLKEEVQVCEEKFTRFSDIKHQAEEEIEAWKKTSRKGAASMQEDMQEKIEDINDYLARLNALIINEQKAYNDLAFGQQQYLVDGFACMEDYRDDYVRYTSTDLYNLKEKAERYEAKTRQQFQDKVLNTLRGHIKEARLTLNQINKTLANMPFNGKIYQFAPVVAATNEYKKYYAMITSPNNTGIEGDQITFDSIAFDDEFAEERNKLFEVVSACAETLDGSNPMLDYRTYCKFGLYECSEDDPENRKVDLQSALGSGSGSEVQIPCYLVLAAALVQKYSESNRRKNMKTSDSIRLILVDECFDKMDYGNANQMIRFTSEMGLQMIAAAPSEKFSSFGEDADSVVFVYRENPNSDKESRHCRQFTSYNECLPYVEGDVDYDVDEDEEQ